MKHKEPRLRNLGQSRRARRKYVKYITRLLPTLSSESKSKLHARLAVGKNNRQINKRLLRQKLDKLIFFQ